MAPWKGYLTPFSLSLFSLGPLQFITQTQSCALRQPARLSATLCLAIAECLDKAT
jgi:hypothetical protein